MGADDANTNCSSMAGSSKETAAEVQASEADSGILAAATLGKMFAESLQRWDARARLQHKPGEADGLLLWGCLMPFSSCCPSAC